MLVRSSVAWLIQSTYQNITGQDVPCGCQASAIDLLLYNLASIYYLSISVSKMCVCFGQSFCTGTHIFPSSVFVKTSFFSTGSEVRVFLALFCVYAMVIYEVYK